MSSLQSFAGDTASVCSLQHVAGCDFPKGSTFFREWMLCREGVVSQRLKQEGMKPQRISSLCVGAETQWRMQGLRLWGYKTRLLPFPWASRCIFCLPCTWKSLCPSLGLLAVPRVAPDASPGGTGRSLLVGEQLFPKILEFAGKSSCRERGREGECMGGIWREKTCLSCPGSPSTDA